VAVLPGLFDFSTGRDSAINQLNNTAVADSNRARSFVDILNAFNTGLNTSDNLEFRQGFQNQPQGTSILDRLDNFAGATSNPFALTQAVAQRAAITPLVSAAAINNPAFGAQQGLATTVNPAINSLGFGINPYLQQQANLQIQQALALNNPQLAPGTFAGTAASATAQEFGNQAEAAQQQREIDYQNRIKELERLVTQQSQQALQAQQNQTPTVGSTAGKPIQAPTRSTLPTYTID
jgi:hypothetical protein